MFKLKSYLNIIMVLLTLPLLFSGCVEKIPAPTAEQSLTAALRTSNFYNYSSSMTITDIKNSVPVESKYEFYLTTDIAKYVGVSPKQFSAYYVRNSELEDIWNFYDYNYLSTGNSINLGYNFYPDDTELVSELSKLCGRFDITLLVRDYFKHQGNGVYEIVDDVKSNLNYTVFNSLPTYALSEFTINVTNAKISHVLAVYSKVGSSDKIIYNVDYSYNITLTQPVEFIKDISVADTILSFEVADDLLTTNIAEIRKLILFSGTVAPDDNECLYVLDEGTVAVTTRAINLDLTLANGTYTVGAWVLAQSGAIDYYQSTFIIS